MEKSYAGRSSDSADPLGYFALRGVAIVDLQDLSLPRWLADELPRNALGKRILDFGCGLGQNMAAMSRLGFDVCGADVDATALAECSKRGFGVFDVGQGLEGLVDSGARFDFILATHVFEHLSKNEVIATLKVLRHLLLPGGSLLLAVPNGQAYTGAYWAYEDFTHATLFTSGSLLYVLRAAGYVNIKLLDVDALAGTVGIRRLVRQIFTACFRINYGFWKRMLASPTHAASVDIFSYEVKARADAN